MKGRKEQDCELYAKGIKAPIDAAGKYAVRSTDAIGYEHKICVDTVKDLERTLMMMMCVCVSV